MRDLASELRGTLDGIEAPDLWSDIGSREPGPARGGPSVGSRIGAALLALVVAAGGLALASRAFRSEPPPVRPATRVENGVLAFRSSEIWVVNPDGSDLRRLNTLECINDACDVAEGSLVLTPWEWSPDGTRLACYGYAYHRADSGGADYAIFVMSADGSHVTDLTSDMPELEGTSQGNPHWSPDGTRLAFDNDDGIYVANADGSSVTKVARGAFPTWSPDGDRIAFVTGSEGGGSEIRAVNADGTGETTITDDEGSMGLPAWSPDGSRIAYVAWGKGGDDSQLYVVNPDGTSETRLTDLRSWGMGGYSPTWSPDGTTIAIEVFQQGNWNIYLVQADGSGVRQLTGLPGDENRPTWSPDGTKIAFMGSSIPSSEGENSGSFDVHVISPDGTDLRQLTDGAGAAPGALTWQPLIVLQESPTPTPSPSPSVEAVVASTTTVGPDGAVRSVVYGEGAVWVAVTGEPAGPGTVLRIDPETDEIVASIPVDAVPGWEVGGAGMTIGAGSVWVTGSVEDPSDPPIGTDAVLARIDPASNEVSTIPLGGGTGGDVVVDENGVWVAVGDEEQGELVRVDPSTNEIVARIPIPYKAEPYQDLRGVLAVDGVILVSQLTFENGESAITAVDAVTNQVLGTSVLSIGALVAWNGEVWTDNGYELVRIDPRTGQLLGEAMQLPDALAAGLLVTEDRGLWFLGYNGRTGEGPRTLSLFDPQTGGVQTFVDVPGIAPNAMAVGPSSVWVLDYHGTLTRIQLA